MDPWASGRGWSYYVCMIDVVAHVTYSSLDNDLDGSDDDKPIKPAAKKKKPSPIDDDDDDLTAGGRPLEPSDSFDVIGEDEDVSSKLVFSRRR